MGAPQSKAAICNLALDYLLQTNEEVVTNIDSPNTATEVICARWYDTTRRSVLRKHPWNFALKRVVLTTASNTPVFGFSLAYNLPVDFIRLATLQDPNSFDPFFELNYQFENNQILTNGDAGATLNLRYVFDFTNVVGMDPIFIDLLAIELALRMAYKFTSSNTNVERLQALRVDRLSEAAAIDGQERPPLRIERSRALTNRRLLGSNQRTSLRFE